MLLSATNKKLRRYQMRDTTPEYREKKAPGSLTVVPKGHDVTRLIPVLQRGTLDWRVFGTECQIVSVHKNGVWVRVIHDGKLTEEVGWLGMAVVKNKKGSMYRAEIEIPEWVEKTFGVQAKPRPTVYVIYYDDCNWDIYQVNHKGGLYASRPVLDSVNGLNKGWMADYAG